ncbi:MAG: glycosyltransferase family 4 protein [Microbacteriaceae bacterium]
MNSPVRLRVVIIYDCLFPINAGGGERVYRRIAELMEVAGGDVTYVTRMQWGHDDPPQAVFDIAPVWRGEIHDSSGDRTLSSALGFSFAVFRYLCKRRGDFDLVFVSALPVLNLFAVRLALLGSRAVIVADWLEVWRWRKWRTYSGMVVGTVAFLLQAIGLHIGDLLTADSQFTADRARHYRRSAEPLVLGLVDLADPPGHVTLSRPDAPFILFVGRHIADKRLIELPAAMLVARSAFPDLRLVIVGQGPETEAVRTRVQTLGLESAVSFAGRVSDEMLGELMSTARVLVNPSQREGFGLVVAEAAAHGTPSVVVAGEDNAAAELVVDGVNGYIADSTEPSVLGRMLVRAVEAGEALRASTLAWFDEARINNGLAASVDTLIERYRARSAAANDPKV